MLAKRVRKSKKEVSEPITMGELTDEDLEQLVIFMWDEFESLPSHVQNLLYDTQEEGNKGRLSYALAAGWATGKFDWQPPNPWDGTKGGWISKNNETN